MKRFLTIIFAIIMLPVTIKAQHIIVGDKMPDINASKWLMDTEPSEAEYSCLFFFHSKSHLCQQALATVKQHINTYGDKLNLTIITKEDYRDAGVALTEHLKDRIGVAFDDNGKTFRHFGVKFIPFCIISHKKRVVWCGNGALLNSATVEKIIKD